MNNDPHVLWQTGHFLPCCIVFLDQQGELEEDFCATLTGLAGVANVY